MKGVTLYWVNLLWVQSRISINILGIGDNIIYWHKRGLPLDNLRVISILHAKYDIDLFSRW